MEDVEMQTHPKTKEAYQLLHDGILVLQRAEQHGMRIDVEYCQKKKKHLTRKINHLQSKFENTNFFKHWQRVYGTKANIDSNWQLAHLLYDVKKIKPTKLTASGKGATDEETLSRIGLPEIDQLLEIRKLKKIRDTYLDAYIREQVNGYLHPSFNLHTVRTYRSSSDHPNFQNVPKRDKEAMKICRQAICPRPGHQLLEIDYSSLEVRISACYHKDPNMINYINDSNSDMHGDMARQIFLLENLSKDIPEHKILRNAAKNGFVFPEFYGDYYGNCAENLACRWGGLPKGKWKKGQGIPMPTGTLSDHLISMGIESYEQFEKHVSQVEEDFWGRRFQVYQRWKDRLWKKYQRLGYVDLLTGFRCKGVMTRNEAINIPIQGSAFHCLLWSFIEIDRIARKENWDSHLVGQIHDAILLDVLPDELERVIEVAKQVACHDLLEAWDWIIVPLEIEADICDVNKPWSEKKAFPLV